MHITFKTILNRIQPLNGFVFSDERIRDDCKRLIIDVTIREHKQREAICPECEKACPTYDHLPEREWQFVPCWGLGVFFHYAPRRVSCPEHGILVEAMPWSDGKRSYCRPMMQFLGNWARRLSWKWWTGG
jgi:transposase